MRGVNISDKLSDLLAPLFNAGWESHALKRHTKVPSLATDSTHPDSVESLILRRTCMVLGVSYDPKADQLTFTPVADSLRNHSGGIGLYDAMAKPGTYPRHRHGRRMGEGRQATAERGETRPARMRTRTASGRTPATTTYDEGSRAGRTAIRVMS